jgi:hypothetical protein
VLRQVRDEREKRFAHIVLRKTMGVGGAPNLLMMVVSQLAVLLESQPHEVPQAAHFSSAKCGPVVRRMTAILLLQCCGLDALRGSALRR